MPRPNLKSLPITKWFKPKTVSAQLELGLETVSESMGRYRANRNRVSNELVDKGLAIKPYYADNYGNLMDGRNIWQTTIELIGKLKSDQLLIIPYDAELLMSDRWFDSKKGPLNKIRYDGKKHLDVRQAVQKKLRDTTLDDYFTGLDFQGVKYTNKPYKVFTLVDCQKAEILDEELPEDAVKVDLYLPKSEILFSEGALASVEGIPSISRRKDYSFKLKHIGVKPRFSELESATRASYDLTSTHNVCELSEFLDFKYGRPGRRGDEEVMDVHVILGMHRVQRMIEREHPELEVINPFPRPHAKSEDFFWKMLHNVIVEESVDNRIIRRPLGEYKIDMERVFQKMVGYNNELRKRN